MPFGTAAGKAGKHDGGLRVRRIGLNLAHEIVVSNFRLIFVCHDITQLLEAGSLLLKMLATSAINGAILQRRHDAHNLRCEVQEKTIL